MLIENDFDSFNKIRLLYGLKLISKKVGRSIIDFKVKLLNLS